MGIKQSILTNMGMRRDLDVSREDGKHAYENFNVRITASDGETQLAVTNARGNVRLLPRLVTHSVSDGGGWTDLAVTEEELVIEGLLVGYGVLNNHLVLFTHSERKGDATPDRIYRVEYRPGSDPEWVGMLLLESDYGFSAEAPIETLCDFESEDVQKVYWTDGLNQPRFINIADKYMAAYGYDPERTQIDFVAKFGSGLKAEVSKSYATSGAFSGGCLQYVFTYSNKFGQQSNIVLISPMYYASPYGRGGNEEETVNCSFDITLSGADETWDYINIYRIMQTAESGVYTACLVATLNTGLAEQTYNDNGANVETVDAASLLYVGGRVITAYTMCAKDQTLFLGNLSLKGIAVDEDITAYFAGSRDSKGISGLLSFEYTTNLDGKSIPFVEQDGYYPYASQLDLSSDQMRTFKAGEKYRIGIRFMTEEGCMTSCYWVGDVEQTLYPVVSLGGSCVNKAHLLCRLEPDFVASLASKGYVMAELMMAQASAYDRSVAAQGIVVPTLFRLEDRLNDSPHSYSSWYARARNSPMPSRHFMQLPRNDDPAAEVQCISENATPWCSSNDPFDGYAYKVLDIRARKSTYFTGYVKVYYCKDEDGQIVPDYYDEVSSGRYSAGKNLAQWIYDETLKAGFKALAEKYSDGQSKSFHHYVNQIDYGGKYRDKTHYIHFYDYVSESKNRTEWKDETEKMSDHIAWGLALDIDGLSSDSLTRYCSMHRNSFFVDESICTFHSPEITAETQAMFQNAKYKLRVVGMAEITSNLTDYEMEVEDRQDNTCEVVRYNFSSMDAGAGVVGLATFPFYAGYATNAGAHDGDEYAVEAAPGFTSMYIYPFHKTGSITKATKGDSASSSGSSVVTADSGETYDNLVTKTESNMRCCLRTDYLWGNGGGAWSPSNGMEAVVCFSSDEDEPKMIEADGVKRTYMGSYDIILSCRYRNTVKTDSDGNAKWADAIRSRYDDGYLIYDTGGTLSDNDIDAIYGTFTPEGDSIFPSTYIENADNFELDLNTMYYIDLQRKYVFSDKLCLHYDPVQVSVKSTPHAVLSFKRTEDGRMVTLPNVWLSEWTPDPNDEKYKGQFDVLEDPSDEEYGGQPILPWEDSAELDEVLDYETLELFDPTRFGWNGEDPVSWITDTDDDVTVEPAAEGYGLTLEYDLSRYGDDEAYSLYLALMEYAYGSYEEGADGDAPTFEWGKMRDAVLFAWKGDDVYCGMFAGVEPLCRRDADAEDEPDVSEPVPDRADGGHGETRSVRFTVHPDDAELYLDGRQVMTLDGVYDTEAEDGAVIEWSCSREGYVTKSGTLKVDGDASVEIELEEDRSGKYDFCHNHGKRIRLRAAHGSGMPDVFRFVASGVTYVCTSADSAYSAYKFPVVAYSDERVYVDSAPERQFYFIAELYTDYSDGGVSDNRYGGTSENAVEGNVFLPLGNATWLAEAETDGDGKSVLRAYSGDTYFQRWDCQKTYKYSDSSENNINEFVSVMLETYTNIEGRCDVYRGFSKLDVCTPDNTNVINPAYNNLGTLFSSTVLDEKYSLDDLSTQLTWTLAKGAAADVDNWTNVTLASTLDMDGTKGPVRALRMVNNSIICFQDRAVSQVAFNERAQVSTENGVPVELANSGRVDGKRIISDSNGCSNKWSIAQTSGGLYYVDDVRRSLVRFGERMDDLSTSKGLSVWVRGLTALSPWEPGAGRNFRTFYDRTLHDVYFSRGAAEDGLDTLCFSETLDEFMTFHSWGAVTMLESVGDRLVAADTDEDGGTRLWLQGEGPHDLHFGEYQDFHVTFRAAPEPLADKTFTNLEYRADMFDCADGDALTGETFQRVDVWDEHQTGGAELTFDSYRDRYPDVRRRFRVWRADIPRDAKGEHNPFGLNRMRNPWLFLKLTRRASEYGAGTDLRMVMHDLLITYFE